MIKQTMKYKDRIVEMTWHPQTNFNNLNNITQVYGLVFDKNAKLLIVSIKKDVWTLPGGTPEKTDKSWEETLIREVIEEADVEIKDITPIGYQNSIFLDDDKSAHQQLRYFAKVKNILPQTPDPAYNIISKRKFIDPNKFLEYCPWGEIGKEIIRLAVEINKIK